MDDPSPSRTRASRLGREAEDPGDRAEFVRRHVAPILRWGHREADVQDLSEDVLARLVAGMRSFEHDPSRSFRAYVEALAHSTRCERPTSRRRPGAGGSGDAAILDRIDRIEARTWEAFRLAAFEGLSGAEAGMGVAAVLKARSKVQERLPEDVRRLEGDD